MCSKNEEVQESRQSTEQVKSKDLDNEKNKDRPKTKKKYVDTRHERRIHALHGVALLTIATFLKRAIYMQVREIDEELARSDCITILLQCYDMFPHNNILHRELTEIVRFVLLDPEQTRLPSCALLNGFFTKNNNILNFVMNAYEKNVEYKGYMTTIANSILTLTSTPTFKSDSQSSLLTCHEIVNKHATYNMRWIQFETVLNQQNIIERQALGLRNAPLCYACVSLKEEAEFYVENTLSSNNCIITNYLEEIFSGEIHEYCRINSMDDFIAGFMYKKDKKHDHISIPEPTRVSSFIQYSVPMPFHALTFTITFFALCKKCSKLWYCDTVQNPLWQNRLKWVIPTSIKKWYSFGTSEGPSGGAHGLIFSTKGYKKFIVLTDTWSRQEHWFNSIQSAIATASSTQQMSPENFLAIEIDNEIELPIIPTDMSSNKRVRSRHRNSIEKIHTPFNEGGGINVHESDEQTENSTENDKKNGSRKTRIQLPQREKLSAEGVRNLLATLSPRGNSPQKEAPFEDKRRLRAISSAKSVKSKKIGIEGGETPDVSLGRMRHVASTPNLEACDTIQNW